MDTIHVNGHSDLQKNIFEHIHFTLLCQNRATRYIALFGISELLCHAICWVVRVAHGTGCALLLD